MMERKCNKAENNNNNNINKKCMDHIYCHTTKNNKVYNNSSQMTAAGGGGGNNGSSSTSADVLAVLKENKQLKAMLILHLNLIQEQSDQLIAKEKILVTQSEELERLTVLNVALKNQISELQKQLQRQLKRTGEFTAVPPPPLAKIQNKPNAAITVASATTTTPPTVLPLSSSQTVSAAQKNADTITSIGVTTQPAIIGECNGKLISKIILQRVNMPRRGNQTVRSSQSLSTDTEEAEDDDEDGNVDEDNKDANDESKENKDSVKRIVENSANQSQKEMKCSTNAEDREDTGNSTEDSNEVLAIQSKRLRLRQAAKQSLIVPRGAKPSIILSGTTQTNEGQGTFKTVTSITTQAMGVLTTTPTLSRGKHLPLMRWHAPDFHTDESASCDSTVDTERNSTSVTSASPPKNTTLLRTNDDSKFFNSVPTSTPSHIRETPARLGRVKHCSYISTPQLYCCREWENETFAADNNYEFIKAEAKALHADAPMLEIPKWTEHELTPSYCIEGTEDLSDDTFLKRHAKLEICEKRRKKWDVQQIRESRRIERLKRRHCKDEIPVSQEPIMLQSFYPTSDTIQTIQFIQDLPVQAFGEMIPRLGGVNIDQSEFHLPWLHKDATNISNNTPSSILPSIPILPKNLSSLPSQQLLLNSAFVFLKKRKRQQSSSVTVSTTLRQRTLAAKAASIGTVTLNGGDGSQQQLLSIIAATSKNDVNINNSSKTVNKNPIITDSTSSTYAVFNNSNATL